MKSTLEYFDDKGHGVLLCKAYWSIVMKGVMSHCDYSDHGAL